MITKQLHFASDLDGVVVDIVQTLLPELSAICGRTVTREEIFAYDFRTVLELDEAQIRRVSEIVHQDDIYLKAPPVAGAIEFLANTDLDYQFITSRPPQLAEATLSWLRAQGLPNPRVNHSAHGKPLAKEMGVRIFVEDDWGTAVGLAEAGIEVLLFDQPWNRQNGLPGGCTRVFNWDEIAEYLRSRV